MANIGDVFKEETKKAGAGARASNQVDPLQ